MQSVFHLLILTDEKLTVKFDAKSERKTAVYYFSQTGHFQFEPSGQTGCVLLCSFLFSPKS
jgi:hypothetical protein